MKLKTLQERFNERLSFAKNKELCNCPFCGQLYIENDIKGNWTDFFRFNVEGNFWELLFFSVKWIIFFNAFWYVGSYTIIYVLQNKEIINQICK